MYYLWLSTGNLYLLPGWDNKNFSKCLGRSFEHAAVAESTIFLSVTTDRWSSARGVSGASKWRHPLHPLKGKIQYIANYKKYTLKRTDISDVWVLRQDVYFFKFLVWTILILYIICALWHWHVIVFCSILSVGVGVGSVIYCKIKCI